MLDGLTFAEAAFGKTSVRKTGLFALAGEKRGYFGSHRQEQLLLGSWDLLCVPELPKSQEEMLMSLHHSSDNGTHVYNDC